MLWTLARQETGRQIPGACWLVSLFIGVPGLVRPCVKPKIELEEQLRCSLNHSTCMEHSCTETSSHMGTLACICTYMHRHQCRPRALSSTQLCQLHYDIWTPRQSCLSRWPLARPSPIQGQRFLLLPRLSGDLSSQAVCFFSLQLSRTVTKVESCRRAGWPPCTVLRPHIAIWKPATVGIFMPQCWAGTTKQAFPPTRDLFVQPVTLRGPIVAPFSER